MEEDVEEGSKEGKKKREGVKDISELIRTLKKNKVTLTKRQRYQKHVMGFSKESMSRMINGTLASDSAWGPHKVIGGVADRERGAVWGGSVEGLGRKRRDASWFRIDALKGHGKAQVQLALAYRYATARGVSPWFCTF
jgi:TPR repeat protein